MCSLDPRCCSVIRIAANTGHSDTCAAESSSMAHTKEKESFIQKVFYEISLEKDPALWQDDTDTVDKNVERIR